MVGGNRHSRRMRANIPKFEGTYAETGFDRECVSSNPLTPARQSRRRRNHPGNRQKGPQLAGFGDLTKGLWPPEFAKSRANLPKVSGRHREYSRFRETDAGDWVRSPLGGAGRSPIRLFLHFRSGRIGRPQSCTAARERLCVRDRSGTSASWPAPYTRNASRPMACRCPP